MTTALYLNGVFESVLEEIMVAQKTHPKKVYYLQPYASEKIKLLADSEPGIENPIALYISLTNSLPIVSFRAKIVRWRNKQNLSQQELEELNAEILSFQPGEEEIYQTIKGKKCVNLISIIDLERLPEPIPVSCFIKESDGTPLKKRSRAGGWSYVQPPPAWLAIGSTQVKDDVDRVFLNELADSLKLSSEARQERLKKAPKHPEPILVISRAFRRNADVVAEVLLRANGICKKCNSEAPFIRKSDGTPYLEIHHRIALADGGEDTVENAIALCPNCHRYLHFGEGTDIEM